MNEIRLSNLHIVLYCAFSFETESLSLKLRFHSIFFHTSLLLRIIHKCSLYRLLFNWSLVVLTWAVPVACQQFFLWEEKTKRKVCRPASKHPKRRVLNKTTQEIILFFFVRVRRALCAAYTTACCGTYCLYLLWIFSLLHPNSELWGSCLVWTLKNFSILIRFIAIFLLFGQFAFRFRAFCLLRPTAAFFILLSLLARLCPSCEERKN